MSTSLSVSRCSRFVLIIYLLHSCALLSAQEFLDSVEYYYDRGAYSSAIPFFDQAYQYWIDQEKWDSLSNLTIKYGVAMASQGEIEGAIDLLDSTLQTVADHPGAEKNSMGLINGKAFYLRAIGQFDEALELLRYAENLGKKIYGQPHPFMGQTYEYLAICYMDRSMADSVIFNLERAEAIYEKVYDQHTRKFGYFYNNAALMSIRLGEIDRGLDYYKKALKILEEALPESHPTLGIIYNNIGSIYSDRQEFDLAIEYATRAREISQAAGDALNEMYSTFNLSSYYIILGQYDNGIPLLQLAYEMGITNYGEDHINLASILDLLSEVHIQLGKIKEGQDNALKALEIKQDYYGEQNVEVAQSYFTVANAFQRGNQVKEALPYAKRGLELRKSLLVEGNEEIGNSYHQVGEILQLMGQFEEAESNFKQALEIYKQRDYVGHWMLDTYGRLGDIHRIQNDLRGAIDYYKLGLRSVIAEGNSRDIPDLKEIRHAPNLMLTLEGLATCHMIRFHADPDAHAADLDSARDYGQLALDYELMHENLQEEGAYIWSNYSESLMGILVQIAYDSYIFDGDQRHIQMAWDVMSRMKYNALRKGLQSEEAIQFAGLPDSLLQKEKRFRNEIARLRKDESYQDNEVQLSVARLESDYQAFLLRLEKDFPDYYKLKYDRSTSSISELQDAIDDSTQVLQYLLGRDFFFIMSMTSDSMIFEQISYDNEPYRQWIDSLMISLRSQNCREFAKYSFRLSNLFFQPFILPGKKEFIVVPHDLLYALNFEYFLTDSVSASCSFQDLDFAIYHYNFRYIYLPEEILGEHQLEDNGRILAIAPGFENERPGSGTRSLEKDSIANERSNLTRLPWAVKTAEQLKQQLSARLLVGENATEKNLRDLISDFGILHFGTHAEVNNEDPMLSRLVLSHSTQESEEDDFLFTYEIYGLDLHASLVSLTACETGLGKLQNGEGMLSMARAFRYAGCPSVAMSLWKIDDQSSAEIMEGFYEKLDKDLKKDQALREAKLQFLSQSPAELSNPLFWAGMVLVGDNSPVEIKSPSSIFVPLVMGLIVLAVVLFFIFRKRRVLFQS